MHGELPKQIWAKTSRRNRRVLVIGLIVILVAVALVYIFTGSPARMDALFSAMVRDPKGAQSGPVPGAAPPANAPSN